MEKGETEKGRHSDGQEEEIMEAGRGPDRRQEIGETERKTGWQAGGPQGSSLSAHVLEELPEMQVDPILGPQHNSWPGTGTPEGSGASSKRSRVRATATFISFMANCFPMQFLGQGGKRK